MLDKKTLIQDAIAVIDNEINGLEKLKKTFDDNFIEALQLIFKCSGKVIVSGIGKSGHIAKKISATFASTGTPSFFVHPCEASHGDLGMIEKNDLVILLSNSGQTKEIRDQLYYCKKFNIALIGITKKQNSELARLSNVCLIIPDIDEANDINAPTTSTTMMLALGDALAVGLLKIRNFTNENFAVFHPGGKLGSALLKVKSLMRSKESLATVRAHQKMPEVLLEITSKSLGCVAVIDQDGLLIGVITDGDLRRNFNNNFLEKTAIEIMNKNPQIIDQDLLVNDAIEIMNKKSITSLFICEKNKLIGIIHIHDCLKEINT
ncbi:KpsF/GutQ [Alphaproteobacteria bacterium]|nr:KpsF/GutQ [Alphaproteobacteria bacterium]